MSGHVVTFGEAMALIRDDNVGMLARDHGMRLGTGGAEANVAVALRRLGTDVIWVGRVGQDSFGELVTRELKAEGISVRSIADSSAPTGLMIKERRTPSNTRVWYYRHGSAGSRLAVQDLPESLLGGAALVHATGITPALSPSAAAATLHAADTARKSGVPVSFDLNFRSKLWSAEEAGEFYRTILPQTDIVFAGEEEAALAVGTAGGPSAMASRLADFGPSQIVLKLGERGCLALIDGVEHTQEAITVPVVDTVGAGDGFVAGYLSEFLRGVTVRQRILTAVTVGAFACLVPGDWEGMPFRDELGLLSATEPVSR